MWSSELGSPVVSASGRGRKGASHTAFMQILFMLAAAVWPDPKCRRRGKELAVSVGKY